MMTTFLILLLFAIAKSTEETEKSNIIREGDTIYELPSEYIEKGWTDYIFTNNSDILSPSATTNWCQGLYVSPMFTNNTILQRAPQSAAIFGYGTPNSKVTLTFNGKQYTATTASNDTRLGLTACSWRISLPPTDDSDNANGMQRYEITVTSDAPSTTPIKIMNVTFGDIWICTGSYFIYFI